MAMREFLSEVKSSKKFFLITNLSETDATHIWQATSHFIKGQMLQHKGVAIPGLGTFTFSEVKITVGKSSSIVIHRPIFVFSEWFLQTHSLTCIKPCASGHIPVVTLNYSTISHEGSFSRDSTELCIKEILLAISHWLFTKKSIQLDFCNVGRLIVRDSKVKMKFFRDFIRQLDVDGELENIFRPQTTQSDISIMSNPYPSQSSTAKNFLPRMMTSELSHARNTCSARSKKSISQAQVSPQILPRTVLVSRERDVSLDGARVLSASDVKIDNNNRQRDCLDQSSCDGTELCYFCHQRNKRNVYVDLSEEKKRREKQYEKILHDYQDKRRCLATAKDNDAMRKVRHYAEDVSRYNFELAEKRRAEKATKSEEFCPSCIIQGHISPKTECHKREDYRSQLDSQVRRKREILEQTRDQQTKLESKEHRDLTKRLNALEEEYFKEKAARVANYRKALAAQIQTATYKTDIAMDSAAEKHPVFGIHDSSSVKNQRELNRTFVMDHLALVREHEKKAKEAAQATKKEEAEMLIKAKQEFLQEIKASHCDQLVKQKELEDSWAVSQQEKHCQLLSELAQSKKTSILLHEQCEKYKRCQRCQRKRDNRGQSKFNCGTNN